MEAPCDASEPVAPPAMTECDGDRQHARPLPCGHTIEVAHQLREEVVGIEFLDDQLQECTRRTDLAHGSSDWQRVNARVPVSAEGLGSPRCYGGCERVSGDMRA